MLTEAILKSIDPELKPETITRVVEASKNDENSTIAAKTAEWAVNIEKDVFESTGIEKNQGERYFDYLKRAGATLKSKAEKAGDNTELDKLKSELEQARKDLKDNAGDKALKSDVERLSKEVADERQRVRDLQENSTKTVKEWEQKVLAKEAEMIGLKLDNEANAALAGMKFKDEKIIPKDLRQIAIDAAKAKILSQYTPDWIDDGKGGQRQVFRDKTGQVLNNPENALNPFSYGELLSKELTPIIDTGYRQNGAGTHTSTGNGSGGSGTKVDMSGVKSKTEATDRFNQHWMKVQGKPMTHADYNKEYQEAFKELPADLPLA